MPLALTGWEIGLLSTAVVFMIFALVAALVVPRTRPEFPAKNLGWFIAACIVLFAGQMTAVILLSEVGEEHGEVAHETETGEPEPGETGPGETEPGETETTPTEPAPTEPGPTEPAPGAGDPAAGKDVFLGAPACGSCHTLADAGASGAIGPNLDETQPPVELVVDRVTNGSGLMPAFGDSLSETQIQDVAAYVSTAAGG